VLARRRHTAVAGHLGDGAAAEAAWQDPDPGVRALALGALRRAGALRGEVLAAAFGDPAAVVRRRACEEVAALGPSRPQGALRLVEERLADRDATVVEAACFALGEALGPVPVPVPIPIPGTEPRPGPDSNGGAVQAVVLALAGVATSHSDPLCREAAVAALGAIGHGAGLPAILAATTDKAAVRRRAVLALAPFEGPEVDEALARALTDRDWQVRQAAEDLIGPGPTAPGAGAT
jgi:HEAT repeat protein